MSNNDTLKNIVGVALGVCIVCSILVSTTAVVLKPLQDANRKMEKLRNVLEAGGLLEKDVDVEKVFAEKIQPAIIDFETGQLVPKEKMTGEFDPENFDQKRVAKNSKTSTVLEASKDPAKIKRFPRYSMFYTVKESGQTTGYIFPVNGLGLWSVMYGFICLDKDLQKVKGFTFYEHGETPGLGGEVDNPRWKALWKDKIIFDGVGKYQLKVLKGLAPMGSTKEIDGLSGATITTRGIDELVKYWLGPDAFGPFIEKLRKEGV
jgi:Na+-transporting NADH:ubiquinone oxidoreductase subunit C